MTYVNESRSNRGLGFLALQHHDRGDTGAGLQNWGVDGRSAIFGCRVTGRLMPEGLGGTLQDADGHYGKYITDGDSFGDIIGSFLWNHDKAAEGEDRRFPAWRWSWPVIRTGSQGEAKDKGNPNLQGIEAWRPPEVEEDDECPELERSEWTPLKDFETPDTAFKFRTFETGDQKYPKGHLGLAMSGTESFDQTEMYMPTDTRLFAVNNFSDPAIATRVCDVLGPEDAFEVDPVKTAKLHSFFKVVAIDHDRPEGEPATPVLCWNIHKSGCGDTDGGFVYDWEFESVGHIDHRPFVGNYGPLWVGHEEDKHTKETKTTDGEAMLPVHLHMDTYFWKGRPKTASGEGDYDGPLHHNGTWAGASNLPHSSYVWLEWDDCDLEDEPKCLGMHPNGIKGAKPGDNKWGWHRWRAKTPRTSSTPSIPDDDSSITTSPPPTTKEPPPYIPSDEDYPLEYMMTTMEDSVPAFVFRPQHVADKSIDFRNWSGVTDEPLESYKKYTPAVARLEAFGHQNDKAHKGPHCPGWEYTSGDEPDGTNKGRYDCKTAHGGLMFMAPDHAMEHYAGLSAMPTQRCTSTFLMAPGTNLAFGTPDLTTGKLSTTEYESTSGGFSIYVDQYGALMIDTADGVNALFIKQNGNVTITGGIETVPTIAATTKVEAPVLEASTKIEAPTIEIEVLETDEYLRWAKESVVPDTPASNKGVMFTIEDGSTGHLDLYWLNNDGTPVKLNYTP